MAKKTFLTKFFTKQNLVFLLLGLFFLFLFFAFTLAVRADMLRSFDFDTTVKLQAKTPLRLDDFFSFLSVAGRFEFTGSILLIVLMLYGIFKKKIWAVIPLGLFIFAHVIELIGKNILEQPGPPRMFLRSHFTDFPGLHVFTDASYPSGHSLRIVFLAFVFSGIALRGASRFYKWFYNDVFRISAIYGSTALEVVKKFRKEVATKKDDN